MFASRYPTFNRGLFTAHRRLISINARQNGSNFASKTAFAGATLFFASLVLFEKPLPSVKLDVGIPASGDIITVGKPVEEKATGILFPTLCNGYSLAGTGVRIKYGFVKVYAVGSYFEPKNFKGLTPDAIEKALLDPMYPRTIRIVMARSLSIQKFTDALNESLKPRMNGQDLDKLEEFRKLNPPVDLIKGAEMELTIRGDTLLYKNATGAVGMIHSAVFTRALCDVYFGSSPVSPALKESTLEAMTKL